MIDPYYTRYQHNQYMAVKRYDNTITSLHQKRNYFLDIGEKEAAQRCWDELSALQKRRDELATTMVKDREDFSAAMIKVFLLANLTYAKAMEFQALIKERTEVEEEALGNDVAIMVKAAESIALMIDSVGHDKQANALSDIIDNLEESFNKEVEPKLDSQIEEFRRSKQFKLF